MLYFMKRTHELLHLLLDDVRFNKIWIFLQVLFDSLFCLMKFLNMEIVRYFEVMLEHTLNHTV
jgi:hypothetical protein